MLKKFVLTLNKSICVFKELREAVFYRIFVKQTPISAKFDHDLFELAVIVISNAKTGDTFKAGQINLELLVECLRF